MLAGTWGVPGHHRLATMAQERGLEVVRDGELALAAAPGALTEARGDRWHVWVIGRVDPVDGGSAPGSAAETLVAALERSGPAGQAAVHGAYVLAAYDRVTRRAFVSHDHLAARGVVYTHRSGAVLFAEHVADLISLLPATPVPDRLAVVQWLSHRTLPGDRTLYSSIERLAPGHRLDLSGTGGRPRRFWRPEYRESDGGSAAENASAVRDQAFSAIRRSAEGLRRPGVKLSGGLDSACVAAGLAAAAGDRSPLALAGVFPDYPDTDESELIEQTAHAVGLELVAVPYVESPVFAPVQGYIERWALPPWSPMTAIWGGLTAAARAREVDGLLDGEGGDELFGTTPQLIAEMLLRGRVASSWRLAGALPGMGLHPSAHRRLRVLRYHGVASALPAGARRLRRRVLGASGETSSLLYPGDAAELSARNEAWTWRGGDGPLWWRAAVDGRVLGPYRVDASAELRRAALDAGIEGRHPFIHDALLVEAMLAIAPEQLFDPVRNRPLLRDGLAGVIPEAVRSRFGKSYFNELLSAPMAAGEGRALLAQLSDPDAPIRSYVRPGPLEELAELSQTAGMDRHRLASAMFRLASLNNWLRFLEAQEKTIYDRTG